MSLTAALEAARRIVSLHEAGWQDIPQDAVIACRALLSLADAKDDLAEMWEKASAATKGEWTYENDDEGSSMGWVVAEQNPAIAKILGDSAQAAMDAAHIASAHPEAVMRLIARVRMAEAAKE